MFTSIFQYRATEWREKKKSKMAAHGNVTPTSRSFLPFSVFFNQWKNLFAFAMLKFDCNVFNLQLFCGMKWNQQIFTSNFWNRKVMKIYQNQAKREMLYSMYVKWFNQLHSNLTSAIRRLWWQKNRQSNIARFGALSHFLSDARAIVLTANALCESLCAAMSENAYTLWI